MVGVFKAKYSGWCLCCEERIHEGEPVKWADGNVIHADCLVLDGTTEVPAICPTCHMVPAANGACDCDNDSKEI